MNVNIAREALGEQRERNMGRPLTTRQFAREQVFDTLHRRFQALAGDDVIVVDSSGPFVRKLLDVPFGEPEGGGDDVRLSLEATYYVPRGEEADEEPEMERCVGLGILWWLANSPLCTVGEKVSRGSMHDKPEEGERGLIMFLQALKSAERGGHIQPPAEQ